jgi:hypothetical protein
MPEHKPPEAIMNDLEEIMEMIGKFESMDKLPAIERDIILSKLRRIYEDLSDADREIPETKDRTELHPEVTMPEPEAPDDEMLELEESGEETAPLEPAESGNGQPASEAGEEPGKAAADKQPAETSEEPGKTAADKHPAETSEGPGKTAADKQPAETSEEPGKAAADKQPAETSEEPSEEISAGTGEPSSGQAEKMEEMPEDKNVEGGKKSKPGTIAEKLTGNKQYVYDNLAEKSSRDNLSTKLQSKPISDIASAIGINDKFQLIRDLFNGDTATFNKTLEILNGSANFNEAFSYINETFDWDMEDPSVQLILDLVRRKFIVKKDE